MRTNLKARLPILIVTILAVAATGSIAHATDPIPGVDVKVGKATGGKGIAIAMGTTNTNGDAGFMGLPAGDYVVTITYGGNEFEVWGDPHENLSRITINAPTWGRSMAVPTVFTAPLGEIDVTIEVHGTTMFIKVRASQQGTNYGRR